MDTGTSKRHVSYTYSQPNPTYSLCVTFNLIFRFCIRRIHVLLKLRYPSARLNHVTTPTTIIWTAHHWTWCQHTRSECQLYPAFQFVWPTLTPHWLDSLADRARRCHMSLDCRQQRHLYFSPFIPQEAVHKTSRSHKLKFHKSPLETRQTQELPYYFLQVASDILYNKSYCVNLGFRDLL